MCVCVCVCVCVCACACVCVRARMCTDIIHGTRLETNHIVECNPRLSPTKLFFMFVPFSRNIFVTAH